MSSCGLCKVVWLRNRIQGDRLGGAGRVQRFVWSTIDVIISTTGENYCTKPPLSSYQQAAISVTSFPCFSVQFPFLTVTWKRMSHLNTQKSSLSLSTATGNWNERENHTTQLSGLVHHGTEKTIITAASYTVKPVRPEISRKEIKIAKQQIYCTPSG